MKAYHWRPLLEEREAKKRAPPPAPMKVSVQQPKGAAPANARRGVPICVECAFHACTYDWTRGKLTHWCLNPMSRHPVTGAPTDPSINRRDKLDCGPFGSYWEAKAPAPKRERVVHEVDDSEPMDFAPPVPVRRIDRPARDEVIAQLYVSGASRT